MLLLPLRYSSLQHRQSMDTWWQNVHVPKHGETIDDSQIHRHRHALKHHSIITLTGISCEAMGQLMDSFLRYSDNPWVFGLRQIWKGKKQTRTLLWNRNLFVRFIKVIIKLHWKLDQKEFSFGIVSVECFRKKEISFYFQFGLIYVWPFICGQFHLPLLSPSNKFSTWNAHNANKPQFELCVVLLWSVFIALLDGIMQKCHFLSTKTQPATINNVFSRWKAVNQRHMELVHYIEIFRL